MEVYIKLKDPNTAFLDTATKTSVSGGEVKLVSDTSARVKAGLNAGALVKLSKEDAKKHFELFKQKRMDSLEARGLDKDTKQYKASVADSNKREAALFGEKKPKAPSADSVIAAIGDAKNVAEVNALIEGEKRTTVVAAANKKIESFGPTEREQLEAEAKGLDVEFNTETSDEDLKTLIGLAKGE